METDNRHIYVLEDGTRVSTVDRFCQEVPDIAHSIPSDSVLFDTEDKPNLKFLKDHFTHEGRLSEAQTLKILNTGTALLKSEPNLLETDAPIIICGDVHGQFYDLVKLFDVSGGEPPAHKYLFLGDYVDRGYFSLECYLYLLTLKIHHPNQILMLRGNHECRHLTKHFTFKLECTYKTGVAIYEACMKSFDSLPLCAVVNKQFFCVHGGLSPEMKKPSDANSIDRFQELPKHGMMCDFLWSDPTEDFGAEGHDEYFVDNCARGCSYRYSYKAVCNFLSKNNLLSVIRGHEAQDAGYRLYRQVAKSEFPALITLFSAPNYVDVYNNKGAVMCYDGNVMNIRQFNCAPHPYYLPKFMNVFDWSLPFVGEKIADLLMAVLNIGSIHDRVEGMSVEEYEKLKDEKDRKMNLIRSKIKAVSRVNIMLHNVRNERERLVELMNVLGTNVVPAKYLTLGQEELRRAISSFQEAKESDRLNEMMPDIVDDTGSVYSLSMSDPPPSSPDLQMKHHAVDAMDIDSLRKETPPPSLQNTTERPSSGL